MYYSPVKLQLFVSQIMQKVGLSQEKSDIFAESLIWADMRGIKSHGVTRLKSYAFRIESGLVDADADITIVRDNQAMLLIDGNNGMGVLTAQKAMRLCIDHAMQSGACFASVRGGNHFGIAEYYTDYAAQKGMIGIAMCNAPKAVAPTGTRVPLLGTNPFSISIPSSRYPSMNLDMATSVVARGKVMLAKKNGETIPDGWAVDSMGVSTTNPNDVNCMMPFGGYKGSGIGLSIEVLSSCLSGASASMMMTSFYDYEGPPQNTGFFLGAINVSSIMEINDFCKHVDDFFDVVKNAPKAEGCEKVYLPGEMELERVELSKRVGLEIGDGVIKELSEISEKYGVQFDCAM